MSHTPTLTSFRPIFQQLEMVLYLFFSICLSSSCFLQDKSLKISISQLPNKIRTEMVIVPNLRLAFLEKWLFYSSERISNLIRHNSFMNILSNCTLYTVCIVLFFVNLLTCYWLIIWISYLHQVNTVMYLKVSFPDLLLSILDHNLVEGI